MLIFLVIILFFVLFVLFALDCFRFKRLPETISLLSTCLSFFIFFMWSFCLLDVSGAYYKEEETIERYNNLIHYYEICEQDGHIDYGFYEDVIEWNAFVEQRQNLLDNVWCRNAAPGWYADLEYVEVPDVTIVDNHNLL